MNKHIITVTFAFVLAAVSAFSSFAQARIDRLVKDLEKASDVEVTYTERRDPKTKKLIKQSIILSGNSKKQYEQLWNAFEQERDNSVSVTKTRNRSFVIKFQDKNTHSSYVLSGSGTTWSLVVTKRDPNASDDNYSYNGFDFNGFDFDYDGFAFNDLSRLGELEGLDGINLDELNNLDFSGLNEQLKGLDERINGEINGNVTVYDSNGNVIYKNNSSSSESSKNKTKAAAKSAAKSAAKTAAKSAAKSASSPRSKSKSTSISISNSNSNSVRTVTTSSDGKTTTTVYQL